MTAGINEVLAAGEAAVRGTDHEVLAAWPASWRSAASCEVWDHWQLGARTRSSARPSAWKQEVALNDLQVVWVHTQVAGPGDPSSDTRATGHARLGNAGRHRSGYPGGAAWLLPACSLRGLW